MVRNKLILIVILVLILLGVLRSQKSELNPEYLIQAAIKHSYDSIYNNLEELRVDYPDFNPRVRRWSDDLVFLFGAGLYAVQMPEEEVVVDSDGKFRTTRSCKGMEAECTLLAPLNPELGVIGTVQLGNKNNARAEHIKVSWEGGDGYVYVSGNCFAAHKQSKKPLKLIIQVLGYKQPIEIKDVYGYRLVAATMDDSFNFYSSMRVNKSIFKKSNSCEQQARDAWPNVGGGAWKR